MDVKSLIKGLATRVNPRAFETLQIIRARRHQQRLQQASGLAALNKQFVDRYGTIVRSGPFRGTQLIEQGLWSNLAAKLLGAYESELSPALERFLENKYECAVDIGCADGYYAAGLACRLKGATVYAYDLDPACRKVCRLVGKLNHAGERLVVRGRCDHEELRNVLLSESLVVCDCEGYEQHLLDPAAVPALRTADLVVEFHLAEGGRSSTEQAVIQRFTATHDISILRPQARDAETFPEIGFLPRGDRDRLIGEARPAEQSYGVLTAKRPTR
jgi:hypothetical protein